MTGLRRTPRRRDPDHGVHHQGGDRRAARRQRRRHVEMRRQGRPPSRSRAATGLPWPTRHAASRSPRQATDETTFLGAHVVPPEYAWTRPGTSTWSPARCSRPARHARSGSTCSARRVPSTPTRPRTILRAGGLAGSPAGCTRTSSDPAPASGSPMQLGLAAVDHCTYLSDADVDALAGGGTVATLLPGVSSPPARRTPTPGGCSTPAAGWPSPATATQGRATPRRCRCASRWRWRCG